MGRNRQFWNGHRSGPTHSRNRRACHGRSVLPHVDRDRHSARL